MNKTNFEKIFSKKALVPFISCGYPSLADSEKIIHALARGGADLIELGIPFSDPMAEGPTIMKASEIALKNGASTNKIFEMIERVRNSAEAGSSVPLAFMTYANIVFTYGVEKFLARCSNLGICALILPDVPFEEKDIFERACKAHGVALVSFIAPTSGKRVKKIALDSQGFIYLVSSFGVTGIRENLSVDSELAKQIQNIRKFTKTPICVGFGISNATQAKEIAKVADGVIIGSAIVEMCGKKNALEQIESFTREVKTAINLKT